MSDPQTEANRASARRFIEQVGRGILDDSLLGDDPKWWVPGIGTIDRPTFEGFVRGFHDACATPPDMKVTGITADADRVAVEATCQAQLRDGTQYDNSYHFLLVFEDGKIVLAKEYNDTRHSAETVGAMLVRQPTA
ncbi:MAG: nuclear transport factor 2 family protein [Myxococcota bacterium]|jgi:hypothetical protein|nr:nuclear transport factor 2 family protein [Myxococcota bacterium]